MQLFGPSGVRQFPTDRSPLTVANGAAVAVTAGGAGTTHGTYTVPALRRAILGAHGSFTVSTALAVGQVADMKVEVTPSGGAAQEIHFVRRTGSALDQRAEVSVEGIQLRAGDLVIIRTEVTAGAGAVTGTGGLQGVEYDA